MSWLELDDGILEHPKFIRLVKLTGSDGVHLWLGLRAYCGRHLTDGCIPFDMLDEVRGPASPRRRGAALQALFDVGLIEKTSVGVQMHDFLDWSRSREDVTAMRERARERKAKSRAGHTVTSAVTPRAVTPVVTLPSPLHSPPLLSTPRREEITPHPSDRSPPSGDSPSGVFAVAPVKPKREKKPKLASWRRFPADFEPDDGHRKLAKDLGVSLAAELAVIRDHHFDKPKQDPAATLRNWLRTAARFAPTQQRAFRPDPRNEAQDLNAMHESRKVLRDLDQSAKIRSEYEAAKRMFEGPNGHGQGGPPKNATLPPPRASNGHLKGAASGQ